MDPTNCFASWMPSTAIKISKRKSSSRASSGAGFSAKKHYGEEADVVVEIDRATRHPRHAQRRADDPARWLNASAHRRPSSDDPEDREAERDALFAEYEDLKGQLVTA